MDRRKQPTCLGCGHPRSFHGSGRTRCHALGCTCKKWAGIPAKAPAWLVDSLTVAELGRIIHKTPAYVRTHAKELGGYRAKNAWFVETHSGDAWRFPRSDFETERAAVLVG